VVSAIGGNHLAAELIGCSPVGYGRDPALAKLIEQASEPRPGARAGPGPGRIGGPHTHRFLAQVDEGTRRYLTFLADCGYTLSNVKRRACGQDPLPTEDPSGV
jgi:ParB family transcriptional regulator, chromosome partitioning protein